MNFLADIGAKADTNGDMAIDYEECAMIEEEFESMVCTETVSHCDMNGDGVLEGCEFLACVEEHAMYTGCIARCPCDGVDSMYCNGL